MASGIVKGLLRSTAITRPSSGLSKGSIFFLHGTCDSGPGFKNWISHLLNQELKFTNYKILYPSSPVRSYKLMNNQNAAVWFDRLALGPEMPEDILSINEVGEELSQMIYQERKESGIPMSKIIIGGFSMGGSMALHLGYRMNQKVGGVFALSSYLPPDSPVYSSLEDFKNQHPPCDRMDSTKSILKDGKLKDKAKNDGSENRLPKLLMSHGEKDPLVNLGWCKSTFEEIRKYGAEGHFYTFPNQTHEVTKSQLTILHNWIDEVLSDEPKRKINHRKAYHLNDSYAIPILLPWKK